MKIKSKIFLCTQSINSVTLFCFFLEHEAKKKKGLIIKNTILFELTWRSTDKLLFLCKAIAHSIQSRLLYVPAKFQGLKTNNTGATSNFLRLFKTGNYFCGIVVCDVVVRHQRMIYIHIIENRLDFDVVKNNKLLW